MKVDIGRLLSLLDYVEAAERDRLPTVVDMADYRGFRRHGDEIIKVPGVRVNVRDADDPLWLSVERLVRRPPPKPGDAALGAWIDLSDDVSVVPSLRSEIPNDDPSANATLRLDEHADRARLDALLVGYVREIWSPLTGVEDPF